MNSFDNAVVRAILKNPCYSRGGYNSLCPIEIRRAIFDALVQKLGKVEAKKMDLYLAEQQFRAEHMVQSDKGKKQYRFKNGVLDSLDQDCTENLIVQKLTEAVAEPPAREPVQEEEKPKSETEVILEKAAEQTEKVEALVQKAEKAASKKSKKTLAEQHADRIAELHADPAKFVEAAEKFA